MLVPGIAMASATIVGQFTPATIVQGDPSVYKITLANDVDGVALSAAKATVLFGPDINVTGAAVRSNTCGGTPTITTGTNGKVELVGGTVPAAAGSTHGKCEIEIDLTSIATGNHTVSIPKDQAPTSTQAGFEALEGSTPIQNSTDASATLLVTGLDQPTGNKTFTPATAIAGADNTLTITLSNPNQGATMPLTEFMDNLPTGMTVADPASASITCSGTGFSNGTVTATPGSSEVSLTGGVIGRATNSATPGTCVVSVRVRIPMSEAGNTLNNTVLANAIGNTRGLGSPAFNKTVLVQGPLTIGKAFADPVIPVGVATTMTLTVTNRGDSDMSGTTVADTLPGNMVVATPSVTGGTCASTYGGTVTANGGSQSVALSAITLPAGASCTVTAQVTATAEGKFDNTATAQGTIGGESTNASSAAVPLTAYGQLRVVKSVQPTEVAPGQWVQYSVQVQNYTGSDVNNISLKDTLPKITVAGTDYQMSLINGFIVSDSCGVSGMTYTPNGTAQNAEDAPELYGTGGSVNAGTGVNPGSCTVVFRAKVPVDTPANTSVTFGNGLSSGDVTGTCASGCGNVGNTANVAAHNVAVVDAVGLNKDFRATDKSMAAGQASRLRLTVFNRYVTALTSINLIDDMPADITLAANPGAVNTCGGTLDAFPNGSQIKLTGGSIIARGDTSAASSCYVEVSVTGSKPGSYFNTVLKSQFSSSGGSLSADVSDTLTVTAGITGSKTFSPASVASGGVARVRVRVINQTPGTLTNVSVNDTGFGAGLTVANSANAATSCGGVPVIQANPGASAVRLDGVTLTGGASCDLSFDVQTSGAGSWTNSIPAGNITSAEGAVNSAVISSTLNVRSAALALNKSFNPVIVTGNQPSLLTIDVVNSQNVAINGASFTDVFPLGIVVYPVPDASTTCPGATVTAVPDSGQVSLTGANLAANSSCKVFVRVTSIAFLNLTNTIPAGAVSSQGGYTNAQPTSATLSTLQGLGVAKGFEPAYVQSGQVSRLKIRLANTFDPKIISSTILTGVTYTDTLPAGLVVAPSPHASTTCTSGTVHATAGGGFVTLTGATLTPGSLCDVVVDVLPTGAGPSYLNTIAPGTVTTDQGVTNPEPGEATLTVVDAPTVGKVFSPATVPVGQTSQLTVTVTNPASVALTGVSLTDNLPAGLAVANTPGVTFPNGGGASCGAGAAVAAAAGATKLVLSGATVAASGLCQFSVNVVASEAKTYTNTIGAGAIQSNQGLTNANPANSDLVALAQPTVVKAFSPVSISSGGTSTLTITLTNPNATDITMTGPLVDALPGNVFVAGTPNLGGTCAGASSVTPGNLGISYGANGTIIPAGSCTITVDVTSSVAGAYTNVIAAGQLMTSAGDNPEPAVGTLGVDQPAAPTVLKSFNPAQIAAGAVSRLTLTLGNPNAVDLHLASAMTDTLPAGVTVALTPAVGGTCASDDVTANAGDTTVVYAANATIPPAGCTIEVNVTAAAAGAYTNTIPAGGLVTTEAGGNPTPANAGLVVTAPSDPTVLKAFSPGTINPGGVSTLTITLGNPNATVATLNADLVDTLPIDVLVATPPAIGGTCTGAKEATAGGTTVTYKSGGVIPANGSCTITVNVTSTVSGGPYTNTIAAGDLKTNLGNNGAPATADLLVNPGQLPSVSKSFTPASIAAGGQSTLTISLGNGNAGALTLTGDMVDTLTGMEAVMPAVTTGTTCDAASVAVTAGSVTYQAGGTIPAGGCVIAVRVTSSTAGTHPNTIAANALDTDGGKNPTGTTANLEVVTVSPGTVASLSGHVYHDRNDNGAIDPGEEGIGGVTIKLLQGGTVIATTTTDAAGQYSFTSLPPGTYTVQEVQPGGWNDGKDTAGSKGGTVTNDSISGIVLAGGDAATDYNFGEHKITSPASIPTLSEWGLILLSLMLGLLAWRQRMGVRRQRR